MGIFCELSEGMLMLILFEHVDTHLPALQEDLQIQLWCCKITMKHSYLPKWYKLQKNIGLQEQLLPLLLSNIKIYNLLQWRW